MQKNCLCAALVSLTTVATERLCMRCTPGAHCQAWRAVLCEVPVACQFDRLSEQLCQSLDRLSDHSAKHSWRGFRIALEQLEADIDTLHQHGHACHA